MVYQMEKQKSYVADTSVQFFARKYSMEYAKRVRADSLLKPVTEERDKLKGKTLAGKGLRKGRDGLAIIGGLYVLFMAVTNLR